MVQSLRRAMPIACLAVMLSIPAQAQEGGYVDDLSIVKGKTLSFFISTSIATFDLEIYRLGLNKEKVTTIPHLKGIIQSVPDSAYSKGCKWKPTAFLPIPENWRPGIYEASFPTTNGVKKIIFVVKEFIPGSFAKTVVCVTVNTWQAYNNFGGKSLYNYNSNSRIAAYKVSFDRPFSDSTASLYSRWTDKLVNWLDEEGLPVEYCTNIDLDRDPSFLSHYNTYVTVGHDEYWSRPERNACKSLLDRAGRLIILSGNTCWWQVRFEDNFRTLVCYKGYNEDPLHPSQDSIVTSIWRDAPVNDTENTLIGVSFAHGGYVNKDTVYPASQGYGGYTVYRASNWIYEGTGVRDGDIIGQRSPIVGYETDGALIWWLEDGMIYPMGTDGTPSNFTILGISPTADHAGSRLGTATMGYFSTAEGGAVFNAATTDWVNGLSSRDSIIRRMTHNIFWQFIERKSMPPEIISYSPINITQDSVNFQQVYLAHRTLTLNPLSNDTMVVHAIDPMHKPLHYKWKIGFQVLGTDSVFVLRWINKKDYKSVLFVSCTVGNGFDSMTIFWRLIDSSIRFWTYPPFVPTYANTNYSYMPIAVSMVDERPKCTLESGPSWLSMDSTGTIVGIAPASGGYPITIRARDSHNNTIVQSFKLFVQEPLGVKENTISETQLIASPNPFRSDITFSIDVSDEVMASADIFSISGQRVKSLLINHWLEKGSNIMQWDGRDDVGDYVSAGTYICRTSITPSQGGAYILCKHIIKN